MTEHEFTAWQRYAAHKMLPQRRLELYLAQIAQFVARRTGAGIAPLADFMFDPDREPDEPDDVDLDELKLAFDFNPRN